MSSIKSIALAALVAVAGANAERHVITFENRCGHGTVRLSLVVHRPIHLTLIYFLTQPQLWQYGRELLKGKSSYTSNGPFPAAIAFLQTGKCGANGENCLLLETTLVNPTCIGCVSSTDLSLIPP